jgi:histidine triad (HIT) family protein
MMDDARDETCLFCKIVAGEVPSDVVHSGDAVLAFRDVKPAAPTHLLLIPKTHVRDLSELGEDDGPMLAELMQAAAHLANTEGIDESGWRLVANVGPDAGQSVLHLHFHLLGGRSMGWPPG